MSYSDIEVNKTFLFINIDILKLVQISKSGKRQKSKRRNLKGSKVKVFRQNKTGTLVRKLQNLKENSELLKFWIAIALTNGSYFPNSFW